MKRFIIRHALPDDLAPIKQLADANRETLGFVLQPALRAGIERQGMLVAALSEAGDIIGFAHYWHRKDRQTTLHELCVHAAYRHQGIGSALLNALVEEMQARAQTMLRLKAIQGIAAHHFYHHYGFTLEGYETGKRRRLCLWQLIVGPAPGTTGGHV